jgi:hypothetical protein
LRPFSAIRFTVATGAALAFAIAATALGLFWVQRATGAGDWLSHFLLAPAAAVLAAAHRSLRRRAPGLRAPARVAFLAASMVAAAALLAAALSRGTFWWRDALRLSATSGLMLALLALLGWCAAAAAAERHARSEPPDVEVRDRAV